MNIRTDLAIEMREMKGAGKIDGVEVSAKSGEKAKTTVIEIKNENGASALGKPIGKYITVELSSFADEADITDERMTTIKEAISELVPANGAVLVAGIGNKSITPDSLGPSVASQIFATRHIGEELQKQIGLDKLRPVSSIASGVLGQTGIETAEILNAIAGAVKPAAIITIDALAARKLDRLGRTVQLCDTGISPGSGVGNTRKRIDSQSTGYPVISIGIPTVVDAYTLARDVTGKKDDDDEAESGIEPACENMMVTPREIDVVVERASKLIALAINCALQPSLSVDELLGLM
ncbi:MAG: Germination protease precursor [Firmicutes bacterium ADurb.Bin300]|nr:MAG: Germination protease precursor [Firmicutes bacterium ADurb.Bin300]HOD01910.1 GPR endopeptidase [Clostridiales bacterium]